MSMIDQEPAFNRYLVDTNIVIYTLKGVEKIVKVMEKLENNTNKVYYSTIVEAELFSFHELTREQRIKIRGILDIGEIIDVDSEVALKAAELRSLSRKIYKRKLKLPDAIVAATAFLCSAVLVTRNVEDFNHLCNHGLHIWNPLET
ncbi:MAG TPA: type II toxin-antitoxin system VapC family toxin [Thermoanaerobacterales bacterium]|nr:type II toxin-antitoxin system VapC family toxin [Thermoanaerobacterales bacterium]